MAKKPRGPRKVKTNIVLSPDIKEYGIQKADNEGMSLSVYFEQWLRAEKRKEERKSAGE